MRLIYSRRATPSSVLLRIGQWWGPWTHCAVIDGEHVVESLASRGGVILSPLAEAVGRSSEYEVTDVPTPDDAAGIAWARSQVGRPYDWSGVFGLALRGRDWQGDDSWYCSELVERALVEAGLTGDLARWRYGLCGITPCASYFNRRGV